ncbi:hypothetical protein [Arthrobacter sp. ISL-28]|uniref:hypothetical protein n=1 Tax=Arthrobacter sp. ISL-28 TaxID=2819108 RepID=UPI001BE83A8F|nr:hypothetical protein [Arthrobacter sp. ISL-28]MBT2523758.1 hypothetical protein [Arthrobacter sp. ISL-28]
MLPIGFEHRHLTSRRLEPRGYRLTQSHHINVAGGVGSGSGPGDSLVVVTDGVLASFGTLEDFTKHVDDDFAKHVDDAVRTQLTADLACRRCSTSLRQTAQRMTSRR